jgi:hypothetical protein
MAPIVLRRALTASAYPSKAGSWASVIDDESVPDNEGGRVRTQPEDGFGDVPAAIVSFHHRTLIVRSCLNAR